MTKYTTRLHQGANIRFGLAMIIAIIASVFMVWPNYQNLTETRANIIEADNQITYAEIEIGSERDQYRILKAEYSIRVETDQKMISTVLPEKTDETNIIRALEKKANELAGSDKSLTLETVSFGKTSSEKDADYLSLPIKMKLTGTKEKLMAFLRYLEKTGNITINKDKATRLLDVQDVSMQLKDRGSKTEVANEVSLDLSVNTYILPSLEEIKSKKRK